MALSARRHAHVTSHLGVSKELPDFSKVDLRNPFGGTWLVRESNLGVAWAGTLRQEFN